MRVVANSAQSAATMARNWPARHTVNPPAVDRSKGVPYSARIEGSALRLDKLEAVRPLAL